MATINSNGTGGGDSNLPASWAGGVVPVEGDKVNIVTGDTITMVDTHIWGDDTTTAVNITGTIKASRISNSSLTVKGNFTGNNNGDIDYGTAIDPIPQTVIHDIYLNYSNSLVDGKYGLKFNDGFNVSMIGAVRAVNALTTNSVTAGQNSVDVDDVTGWRVSDEIVLATTGDYSDRLEYDIVIISSIVGNTVTFTTNFTYNHASGCRIGNFTSHITIQPYNAQYKAYVWMQHSSGQAPNSRTIQGVAFHDIGANGSSVGWNGVFFDCTGKTTDVWSAPLKYNSFMRKNTAGNNKYAIAVFNAKSSVNFEDVAIFNARGAGIWTGQGSNAEFDRVKTYHTSTTGVTSSYSEGGVSVKFNYCDFVGATQDALFGQLNGWELNNCNILACYFGIGATHGAETKLNNCTVGSDAQPNAYNFRALNFQATISIKLTDCYVADAVVGALFNIYNKVTQKGYKITIANKDVDPAKQEQHTGFGSMYRDNTVYKTGSASFRFEPVSAATPLTNTWDIFAPSGQPVVVSGYLRKNATYGSATLPKVTLSGLGITPSESTMTDVNDEWVQFTVSGTQTTGTDGILTLTAAFQSGNAGAQAWIDQIVAPPVEAVNSGDFGYWANGAPASLVASNFTSADDVWNKVSSDVTLPGSMGELVKNTEATALSTDTTVNATQTTVNGIDTAVTNLDTDVSNVKTTVDATQTTVNGIDTSVDGISTDVDAVQTTVNTISNDVINIISAVAEVRKYSSNRTKIDKAAFTLTIFDDDDVTPFKVFNLKDANGVASYTEIFERIE